jgi:hypothetical protein
MSIKMHLLRAALVVVSGLSACAPHGGQVSPVFREQTTLFVENNNWSDMTVYIVRDGMRSRVGSIPSFTRSRFVLSPAMIGGVGEIRLLADPLGSNQRYLSEPILVNPGQQVRFRVENNVQLSTYSVY